MNTTSTTPYSTLFLSPQDEATIVRRTVLKSSLQGMATDHGVSGLAQGAEQITGNENHSKQQHAFIQPARHAPHQRRCRAADATSRIFGSRVCGAHRSRPIRRLLVLHRHQGFDDAAGALAPALAWAAAAGSDRVTGTAASLRDAWVVTAGATPCAGLSACAASCFLRSGLSAW